MKNIIIIIAVIASACSSKPSSSNLVQNKEFVDVVTNSSGSGPLVELKFYGGPSLYYPLMAVWLEDEGGNYIQTLFVPRSIATGVFKYGSNASGKWTEAPKRAPQTLPYWSHKRGIKVSDGLYMPDQENPVPDAYSGATPTTSFTLTARADGALPSKFRVLFEINQNWDWNEYWTNDKFPGDVNYLNSAQPALVYESTVESGNLQNRYIMKPVGHSHPSGQTGELFTDLGTLTTALQIADSIVVRVRKQ
ncbi:MAG: hypothetical protein MUC78_01265 [Bacteroidales bacterium]|jgi:hypothetical protein|nr:hypothetical protein [Bacteroidales bacterium]